MELSITTRPTVVDLTTLLAEFEGCTPSDVVSGLISLEPTRHTVELASGTRIYTYCALDTLLIARLLGEDAALTSTPPQASAPLYYRVQGGVLYAPAGVVISFPDIRVGAAGEFKGHFCPYANAFADARAYRAWAEASGVMTVPLTLAQADALAQEYAQHIHAKAPAACGCGCGL